MGYYSDFEKGGKSKGGKNEAFQYIITDLLQNNLMGNDKIRTLTGVDMEKNAPTNFVPTMVYVMMYFNPEQKTEIKGKDFYDLVPLIYCLGCDLEYVSGINFNYMPNDVRAKFLDIITENGKVGQMVDKGESKFKIDEKLGVGLMMGNSGKLISFMKETTGIDLGPCVRKYKRKNIIKSRMVEYDMWDYIPYLNFQDAIRGVNLASVQMKVANRSDK